VIADLNYLYALALLALCKGLKEQRVDGSSAAISIPAVRCTLVTGKPALGRKKVTQD